MEKELSEMTAQWQKAALEDLAKCKTASRSEFVNQMLLASAEVLEWKLRVFQYGYDRIALFTRYLPAK